LLGFSCPPDAYRLPLRGSSTETPVSYAVSLDDDRGIYLLYHEGGAFLDFRTMDCKTPLHRAAAKGHSLALSVRAPPVRQCTTFDALAQPCMGRSLLSDSVVQALLKLGASPHVRDKSNMTPLAEACLNGTAMLGQHMHEVSGPPLIRLPHR